jgi:hypothetical protein
MSDGATTAPTNNQYLISRSHSAQASGHNALTPSRLANNSSAPDFAGSSSSSGSFPTGYAQSDAIAHGRGDRVRAGSVCDEQADAKEAVESDKFEKEHSKRRSASVSPAATSLRTILETNDPPSLPTHGTPLTKKQMRSRLKINIPYSDSAPDLHDIPFSPPAPSNMYARHSFTSLNGISSLKSSYSDIPPPNGIVLGPDPALLSLSSPATDTAPDVFDLDAAPKSTSSSPLKASNSASSGSSGGKFKLNRLSFSPHQIRKIPLEDNNDADGGENSVRYRKNMKASDFGVKHADVAKEAFFALVNLLQIVDGASSKFMEKSDEASPILAHYVHFIFDNPHVYEPLAHYWKLALTEKHPSLQGFKLNWVFFSIISKSMAMKLHSNNLYWDDFNRSIRFQNKFYSDLRALVPFFVPRLQTQRSYDSFTEFPLFVNDLFPLLDRGVILDLVHSYITGIDKSEDIFRVTAVFSFLKTICDYEHFLPLNIPVATETIDTVVDLNTKFWQKHFLIGILLSEVDNCFKKTVAARTQALSTLKALIKKHELDPRYQETKTRQHTACMYFPFLLMVVERFDSIMKFEANEKTDIFRVLLWIVSNLSPNLLR